MRAYPTHKGASKEWIKLHLSGGACAVFIQGYEQAEKDTVERIIRFLDKCNVAEEIIYFDFDAHVKIHFESLEMLIRKAMEEE